MGLKDVLAELRGLDAAGVVERYAIGGAVAALRYVSVASTDDVDVFLTFTAKSRERLDPLAPIYDYLVGRGARVEGEHLVIAGWPVHFLPSDEPLLQEAMSEARDVDVDGAATRVFTAEHLAAIALQLGRPKDKLRVVQMVEEKVLDMARFESILKRHNLASKWDRFSKTILGEQ